MPRDPHSNGTVNGNSGESHCFTFDASLLMAYEGVSAAWKKMGLPFPIVGDVTVVFTKENQVTPDLRDRTFSFSIQGDDFDLVLNSCVRERDSTQGAWRPRFVEVVGFGPASKTFWFFPNDSQNFGLNCLESIPGGAK